MYLIGGFQVETCFTLTADSTIFEREPRKAVSNLRQYVAVCRPFLFTTLEVNITVILIQSDQNRERFLGRSPTLGS